MLIFLIVLMAFYTLYKLILSALQIKFVRENLILNDIKSSEIWLNFIANYECFLGDESGFYRAKIVDLDSLLMPKIYEIFNKSNEKILSFDEENDDFFAICDEILLCELLINLQILKKRDGRDEIIKKIYACIICNDINWGNELRCNS